jgi:Tfp pilus assembly protein PilZ
VPRRQARGELKIHGKPVEKQSAREGFRNGGAVSARRGPIHCEIASEVVVDSLAHPARLRSLSLSRCFVETAAAPREGSTVQLRVHGREGRAEAHAQATVERGSHERVLEVGRSRGVELRLREIDAGFFSLYASLCRDPQKAGAKKSGPPPELSLLSRPSGASGARSERRDGPRVPNVIPLRVYGSDAGFLGATRDLSRTGVFVEAEEVPQLGQQLHLEFTLPDRTFHQECVVVRVADGDGATSANPRGFAARFLPVTELLASARSHPGQVVPGEPLALELDDPAELAAVYLDQIKKGGLFVPTLQPVAENSVVWIELRRHDDALHRARGRVIQCFDDPPGVGVQLLNPRSTGAWFERCMRARRP